MAVKPVPRRTVQVDFSHPVQARHSEESLLVTGSKYFKNVLCDCLCAQYTNLHCNIHATSTLRRAKNTSHCHKGCAAHMINLQCRGRNFVNYF